MFEAFQAWFSRLSFVEVFNFCVMIFFSICYVYQLYYTFVVLLKAPPKKESSKNHKYGILIAARNEEKVICDLIKSISSQDYPSELLDIFVIADNCDDNTAKVSKDAGAIVYERENRDLIGKGYALDFALKNIWKDYGYDEHEAFFVFDADNVLDKNYFKEMNATFDNGAVASTSYRNSKNFDSNWISAGYALWFLKEAKFLNQARLTLNTGAAISGTGFFIKSDVLKNAGGWKWHLLTEDIQFSADSAVESRRISYCPDAIFYDEQPTTFRDSWNQRCRWAKGFYQVFLKYAAGLFAGFFKNKLGFKFACWDMLMTVSPGMLLSVFVLILNLTIVALGLLGIMSLGTAIASALSAAIFCLANYLGFMFIFGILTTFVEWNSIHASTKRKIGSMFTFPIFQLTYIPIAIVALFKKVKWKPTAHNISVDVDEFADMGSK